MTEKSNDLSDKDKVTQASENSEVKGKEQEVENTSTEEVSPEETVEAPTPKEEPVAEESVEAEVSSSETPSKDDEATEKEVVESSDSEEESSSNDEEEEEEHHEEELDLEGLSKTQLLKLIKEKLGEGLSPLKLDKTVHAIKAAFDEFTSKEREEALEKFKADGGVEDDFDFRPSDEERDFNTYYYEFKKQVSSIRKEAEKQKDKNLEVKTEILNKLRELVDGEETTLSMNAIKAIQEEWKSVGPVPSSQNRSLWANYNALMDRFYDNRSIYFELKELDRKKNLESKLELCEKAEALTSVADLKEAIKSLNELHEEFKHIGPVPREDQEALWQRFKTASDAVYDRRKEFYEGQKEVFKKNQVEKEALIEKLAVFAEFKADRIKEWNSKTKEILEIQKDWEKVGPVPRESGREINKAFWTAFKKFFHNKNMFFKELDEIRATNQSKAEGLIEKAEELKDSTDWQNTANALIGLQQEWKKLGPTPEKSRDSLYKRFKAACDTFFDNRRNSNKQANSEYEANYKKKQAICELIVGAAEGNPSESELTGLVDQFNEIGFVPRKNMKDIQAQFKEAVDIYLEKLDDGFDREDFLFRLNLNRIQSDPNANKTLNKKEHGIRKQISDLENNITLWKNNLEFFAASKTADKLKDQFDVKIQKAEEEIEKLKKKLSILREF
ncbi:DUF349 domain-containing protein [Algoriphagus zhangzhouensis]|uniref:DUF349 domain-containing protein n=1 Tax=Algoriphagus zhangzhouensis TaxID=1073327 RepID=A0A1M7Z4W9_9BACT|nr:DUF349 domain-containing protein [Algoriphagus zhangzhouensis]TDY48814.1 uncharacterized protein DUF349 [Algoriphagus zhangzhouensis]SHO59997.1 protein of unknown function [Algoriphagus zhangzhouensis]